MWICPNCSNGNEDQARFCTECGSPRPAEQSAPVQQDAWTRPVEQPAWSAPPQSAPKKSKKGLVIGIVAGLAVVLAGLLLFLFLGGEPRFRETHYTYSLWDGTTGEDVTTYQGKTGRINSYEDGKLVNYSILTLNKDGYVQTELYYDADGTQLSRLEYEYDKNGNLSVIRRFSPEGDLDMVSERTYNDYRVIDRSVTTYYTSYGSVDARSIVEFTDLYNGVSYDEDADGTRSNEYTYRRVYDSKHQMTEEWKYDSDGDMFRVNYYVRDEYHRILQYTTRFYDDDESVYTFEYERIK